VTEAVVDDLEPVEVEIEDGEPPDLMPLLQVVEPTPDAFDKHGSVAQPRERIDEFDAAQALLRDCRVRRVGQRAGKADLSSIASAHGQAVAQEPAVAPVVVTQTAFVVKVVGLAGEMFGDGLFELTDVFRVHAVHPFARPDDAPFRR
jgi:hypothetical protein